MFSCRLTNIQNKYILLQLWPNFLNKRRVPNKTKWVLLHFKWNSRCSICTIYVPKDRPFAGTPFTQTWLGNDWWSHNFRNPSYNLIQTHVMEVQQPWKLPQLGDGSNESGGFCWQSTSRREVFLPLYNFHLAFPGANTLTLDWDNTEFLVLDGKIHWDANEIL